MCVRGVSGIVYKGLWAGQNVAVKKLKHGTRRHVDEFVNECLILGKLRHPVRLLSQHVTL